VPRRLANLALLAAITTLLASGIVAWLLPATAAGILYVGSRSSEAGGRLRALDAATGAARFAGTTW